LGNYRLLERLLRVSDHAQISSFISKTQLTQRALDWRVRAAFFLVTTVSVVTFFFDAQRLVADSAERGYLNKSHDETCIVTERNHVDSMLQLV